MISTWMLLLVSCGSRTGLEAPPAPPGAQCALPALPLSVPLPPGSVAPTCFLGGMFGLTGGRVVLTIAPGATTGATTDISFTRFVVPLTWTDGTSPCGSGPPFTTTNTVTLVINGLRYRAENDLTRGCVRRSRIDFTSFSVTTATPPTPALWGWQLAANVAGPTPFLLPTLDGASLPIATAAATSCPLTSIPTGTAGTRCPEWSELPR
jgi:hypothetical protein